MLLDTILAAARADPGQEMCGLLLGSMDRIEDWVSATNVSPTPATHFEIDPAILFAVQRGERDGGPKRMGHVHSHPSGTVEPSAQDAAMAYEEGQFWLIVSGTAAECWVACRGGRHRGRFDSVAIDIAPPLASPESVGQSGVR